jgi:hypothetical protein
MTHVNDFTDITNLPPGKVIKITFKNDILQGYYHRTSLYTYFGDYTTYINLFYDSKSTNIHQKWKTAIEDLKTNIVYICSSTLIE